MREHESHINKFKLFKFFSERERGKEIERNRVSGETSKSLSKTENFPLTYFKFKENFRFLISF